MLLIKSNCKPIAECLQYCLKKYDHAFSNLSGLFFELVFEIQFGTHTLDLTISPRQQSAGTPSSCTVQGPAQAYLVFLATESIDQAMNKGLIVSGDFHVLTQFWSSVQSLQLEAFDTVYVKTALKAIKYWTQAPHRSEINLFYQTALNLYLRAERLEAKIHHLEQKKNA